jgi:hypothetical protein
MIVMCTMCLFAAQIEKSCAFMFTEDFDIYQSIVRLKYKFTFESRL